MIASEKLIKAAAGAGGVDTGDDDFANVVLLLDGDGTSGDDNNTFTDSDGSYAVTKTNTVRQGSFSPYGNNWSVYFGASVELTKSSGVTTIGTGDFTIEFWFYTDDVVSGYRCFYDTRKTSPYGDGVGIFQNGTAIEVWGNGLKINQSGVVTAKQWTHLALVRSSGSMQLYLDGSASGSAVSLTDNFTSDKRVIGENTVNSGYNLKGYVSNLREVRSAVYTSAFTPPTSPLSNITNTGVLMLQSNRILDNSSNGYTFTISGSPEVTPFSPFKNDDARDITTDGGSAVVTDSSSYLSMNVNLPVKFGTGDFTIEGWFYPNNLSQSYNTILDYDAGAGTNNAWWVIHFGSNGDIQWANNSALKLTGSSGSIKAGQWQHVAVVRNSGTVTIYVNGTSVGSTTDTSNLTDSTSRSLRIFSQPAVGGRWFNGYMSDVRIAKSALYTSTFTPPTSPLGTATNGELLLNFQDAGIYDKTGIHNLNLIGNTQLDTAVVKYGSGSMQFDGSGDYIKVADGDRPQWQIFKSKFTIECWVYANSLGSYNGVLSVWPNGGGNVNNAWTLETVGSDMEFYWSSGSTLGGPVQVGSCPTGQWIHYAVTYDGTTVRGFKNGTLQDSAQVNGAAVNTPNSTVHIGTVFAPGGDWNGYIDDLRVTLGVARYTSNFTAPDAELPKF